MSMRLSDLLRGVIAIDTRLDRDIAELSLDSKSMSPGAAFVALRGHQHHGIEFAAEAVARGAAIVLAEAPLPDVVQLDVPVVAISDLRRHLGSHLFHKIRPKSYLVHPDQRHQVVDGRDIVGQLSLIHI